VLEGLSPGGQQDGLLGDCDALKVDVSKEACALWLGKLSRATHVNAIYTSM